jgi:N-sulfoglucosamine sulfohydrolase
MARNLLLIHCHDLGRHLGCYGERTVVTPNLDWFAAEGTLFERAFSTAPHCSPARASLFTGTYPQTNGVLGLTHSPFDWDLRDPSSHLAHRLRERGFHTALVGVQHESRVLTDAEVAARLGFDDLQSGGDRDVVVERTRLALDQSVADGRPFYLQVGFHEPHRTATSKDAPGVMGFLGETFGPDSSLGVDVPRHLIDDAGAREEIAELQGAVRHMDEGVGQVLDHLEWLGLADDTVVVFTTDHGLALPRAKCTLYDPGLGVALMVRVPDRPTWSGRRVATMVSHVDLLPTLFDLLGLSVPEDIEGTLLTPIVEQVSSGRTHTFGQLTHHTYYDPKRSVRSATHKLIANFSNAPRAMDSTQSWVHRSRPVDLTTSTVPTSPDFELYDVVEDPDELRNLAGEPHLQDVFDALAATLLGWMTSVDDRLLTDTPLTRRQSLVLDSLRERAGRADTSTGTTTGASTDIRANPHDSVVTA